MIVVLLRTIVIYLIIIIGLRLMGKRQLGELQPSELVVTFMVSNIATLPIEDTNIPILGGVVPILTLVCFEVLLSALTLKCKAARRIFSGNPRILIRDGVIDQQEMKNLRFSMDDLMEQLRSNNVFDVREVAYAIVETTGKLSVFQKFRSRTYTAGMAGLNPPAGADAPPIVVISDGQVDSQALEYCGMAPETLRNILTQKGYSAKDIFLMTCDQNADYLIVPRDSVQKGGRGT